MKKLGCSNIEQKSNSKYEQDGIIYTENTSYNCTYFSEVIGLGVTIGDMTIKRTYADPYVFGLGKGQSRCLENFGSKGFSSGLRCYQGNAFFTLDH